MGTSARTHGEGAGRGRLDRHGDAVKKPWYALTSAGDMTLGYLEVTLDA
jgi:hypothetical protein